MQANNTIQSLVNSYFALSRKYKEGGCSGREDGALTALKKLEQDIFSLQSRDYDDLERKVMLTLHFLEDEDSLYHTWNAKEQMFKSVLHDVMTLYAQKKTVQAAQNAYNSPEAPLNYYSVIGGCPKRHD